MFRFQIQNAIFFPQKIFDNNKLTDTSFASAPVPYSASDWLTLTQPLINLTNRGNQEQAIRSRVVKNLVGEKPFQDTLVMKKVINLINSGSGTDQSRLWDCGSRTLRTHLKGFWNTSASFNGWWKKVKHRVIQKRPHDANPALSEKYLERECSETQSVCVGGRGNPIQRWGDFSGQKHFHENIPYSLRRRWP